MIDFGDVPASTTLYFPFASYGKTDGDSITLTGLAVTDVECYKNGSVTQRTSDNGVALLDSDGIDFDGITGIHGFSIDLSDNSDSGFWSVGGRYFIVVSAVTIDTETVNFIAGTFRIVAAEAITGKPKVDVDAWLGTAAATPTVAGVPEVDVTHYAGATTNVSTMPTNIADILTDTGTTLQAELDGIQADTEDIQSRLPAALVNSRMDCTIDGTGMESGAVDSILNRDASGSTTNSTLGAIINDWENGGRLDLILDDILLDTGTTLQGELDGIQATIGVAGAGLTDLGGMSTTMKGQVESEANDALVALNLDHLLAVAAVAGDAVDNSIIARMTSKSATPAFSSFVNTSDSLEALRDQLATAAALSAVASSASSAESAATAVNVRTAGITLLRHWLGAMVGKQTPDATALSEINATGAGSGTYDATTDSLEAERDNIGTAGAGLTALAPASTALSTATWTNTLATNLATLVTKFTGITLVAQWLGLIAGKQTGNTTARTELNATGAGSGTFDETTDSTQAIRDRGDAAWGAGAVPSVGDIADAVWDEALAGHGTAGSAGAALSAAGAAADPLASPVPGAYVAGTAGYILGNLDDHDIVFESPVVSDGEIDIVRGADYYTADGRDLIFTITGRPYTPTSCYLTIACGSTITITGTVEESSGSGSSTFHLVFQIPRATGDDLDAGTGTFEVVSILANGHENVEIAEGKATIRRRLA